MRTATLLYFAVLIRVEVDVLADDLGAVQAEAETAVLAVPGSADALKAFLAANQLWRLGDPVGQSPVLALGLGRSLVDRGHWVSPILRLFGPDRPALCPKRPADSV